SSWTVAMVVFSSTLDVSPRHGSRRPSRPTRHVGGGVNLPREAAGSPVASRRVNQMKNRMQALGLLDRSFKAATDEELAAAIEALDDDHREGLESFVDGLTPDGVRAGVKAGRI